MFNKKISTTQAADQRAEILLAQEEAKGLC